MSISKQFSIKKVLPTHANNVLLINSIFVGPEAFAKAVRASKDTLLTDTTMRDAHQVANKKSPWCCCFLNFLLFLNRVCWRRALEATIWLKSHRKPTKHLLPVIPSSVGQLFYLPTTTTIIDRFFAHCFVCNRGGATFDVAMRFLYEDPFDRLRRLRRDMPDVCLQMLLRGANAVRFCDFYLFIIVDCLYVISMIRVGWIHCLS
jgi:hypothetical protein